MLTKLLALLPPSSRPVVVALIAMAIAFLLFRPRHKPARPSDQANESTSHGGAGNSKLLSRPALSISTVDTLLTFAEGTPRLIPGALDALKRISTCADIYLVTQLPVDSDELEASALNVLSNAGCFEEGGCDRRKAMFCSTEDGRGAMIRQLSPATHLDTSPKVLRYLAPHLPRVVYVDAACRSLDPPDGSSSSSSKAGIVSVASLDAFAADY